MNVNVLYIFLALLGGVILCGFFKNYLVTEGFVEGMAGRRSNSDENESEDESEDDSEDHAAEQFKKLNENRSQIDSTKTDSENDDSIVENNSEQCTIGIGKLNRLIDNLNEQIVSLEKSNHHHHKHTHEEEDDTLTIVKNAEVGKTEVGKEGFEGVVPIMPLLSGNLDQLPDEDLASIMGISHSQSAPYTSDSSQDANTPPTAPTAPTSHADDDHSDIANHTMDTNTSTSVVQDPSKAGKYLKNMNAIKNINIERAKKKLEHYAKKHEKSHNLHAEAHDLLIPKGQIVPPICPVCPPPTICASERTKPCPPCPPCKRCPEPTFECKKVVNYKKSDGVSFNENQHLHANSVDEYSDYPEGTNKKYLPRPLLTDFSTFDS